MGYDKMSEKREKMLNEKAGKLLQHRHCQVCYKAIPLREEFCSDTCIGEYNKIMKKRKNTLYLFYAMIIVFMFLFVLMMVSGQ